MLIKRGKTKSKVIKRRKLNSTRKRLSKGGGMAH